MPPITVFMPGQDKPIRLKTVEAMVKFYHENKIPWPDHFPKESKK